MANETTLAELRAMADRAGLTKISDKELADLKSTIDSSAPQLQELRNLLTDEIKPATIFVVCKTKPREPR